MTDTAPRALTLAPSRVRNAQLVTLDGATVGRITRLGATYRAARRVGESGHDIRKVSQGFRTEAAAVAWIARADDVRPALSA